MLLHARDSCCAGCPGWQAAFGREAEYARVLLRVAAAADVLDEAAEEEAGPRVVVRLQASRAADARRVKAEAGAAEEEREAAALLAVERGEGPHVVVARAELAVRHDARNVEDGGLLQLVEVLDVVHGERAHARVLPRKQEEVLELLQGGRLQAVVHELANAARAGDEVLEVLEARAAAPAVRDVEERHARLRNCINKFGG